MVGQLKHIISIYKIARIVIHFILGPHIVKSATLSNTGKQMKYA